MTTDRKRMLMKGNEALAEGAISAGCRFFSGYPITPQNEIPEYMSWRMPEVGGTFIQAESEIAAINMVYGAAGAGERAMTSSSSPGISLKQEGISYIAGAELPAVIANVVRAGPGLGGIQPAQSDYFQATRGGGHGDYNMVVLAPGSVQEMFDLTAGAFDIADRYRNPVMILADGMLGQMMEPLMSSSDTTDPADLPAKPWATTGRGKRHKPNLINSLFLDSVELHRHNEHLQAKYRRMAVNEVRVATRDTDDAGLVVVAYGTMARIAAGAVIAARREGLKVGLVRPISLWPFPGQALRDCLDTASHVLTVEISYGQMVDDVKLAVGGRVPVHFLGMTGIVPTQRQVLDAIRNIMNTGQVGERSEDR